MNVDAVASTGRDWTDSSDVGVYKRSRPLATRARTTAAVHTSPRYLQHIPHSDDIKRNILKDRAQEWHLYVQASLIYYRFHPSRCPRYGGRWVIELNYSRNRVNFVELRCRPTHMCQVFKNQRQHSHTER